MWHFNDCRQDNIDNGFGNSKWTWKQIRFKMIIKMGLRSHLNVNVSMCIIDWTKRHIFRLAYRLFSLPLTEMRLFDSTSTFFLFPIFHMWRFILMIQSVQWTMSMSACGCCQTEGTYLQGFKSGFYRWALKCVKAGNEEVADLQILPNHWLGRIPKWLPLKTPSKR